jgi:hypothetical protein
MMLNENFVNFPSFFAFINATLTFFLLPFGLFQILEILVSIRMRWQKIIKSTSQLPTLLLGIILLIVFIYLTIDTN